MSSAIPAPARLAIVVVLAFAYGRITAALPAPHDPERFWLGNIGSPYVLLPFLAGAWGFGRSGAWLAGGLAGLGLIAGFYDLIGVAANTNSAMELPLDTPDAVRIVTAYGRWVSTFALGQPGGIPWLTIAVALGAVVGWLGWHWRTTGSRLAVAIVVAPFLAEPVIYLFGLNTRIFPAGRYALDPLNLAIWVGEVLVGLGLWRALTRRHRATLPAAA